MIIQISGFDDKFNILGLVIETIEPPSRGLIYVIISSPSEGLGGGGGLNRRGTYLIRRGLFNLETTMASVLYKELEYKVEKLKYKKFYVMQPRIRIKSELPVGKQ